MQHHLLSTPGKLNNRKTTIEQERKSFQTTNVPEVVVLETAQKYEWMRKELLTHSACRKNRVSSATPALSRTQESPCRLLKNRPLDWQAYMRGEVVHDCDSHTSWFLTEVRVSWLSLCWTGRANIWKIKTKVHRVKQDFICKSLTFILQGHMNILIKWQK